MSKQSEFDSLLADVQRLQDRLEHKRAMLHLAFLDWMHDQWGIKSGMMVKARMGLGPMREAFVTSVIRMQTLEHRRPALVVRFKNRNGELSKLESRVLGDAWELIDASAS